MTNKEAKEVLQEQIDRYGQEYDAEGIEALETAINVLEQQPSGDCISRQAAIDVVRKWFDKIQLNGDICLDGIISLPPVTPKTEPCEDYIKRADVLKYAQLIRDDEGIVHEMVHVDDIKDASSVTWSGWTPATQLPEPSTAVLLHVKYKSSGQWTYQLGMWNDNKQAWEDWRTPYQLEEEFEVIAWMELPEKYEEDSHE